MAIINLAKGCSYQAGGLHSVTSPDGCGSAHQRNSDSMNELCLRCRFSSNLFCWAFVVNSSRVATQGSFLSFFLSVYEGILYIQL